MKICEYIIQLFVLNLLLNLNLAVHFMLEDACNDSVILGNLVEIIGVMRICRDSENNSDSYLEAKVNNLRVVPYIVHPSISSNSIRNGILGQIFGEHSAPIQMSNAVVDLLGAPLIPTFAWRKLKLSMLLSLVSISEKGLTNAESYINVFIATDSHNPLLSRFVRSVQRLKRFLFQV